MNDIINNVIYNSILVLDLNPNTRKKKNNSNKSETEISDASSQPSMKRKN